MNLFELFIKLGVDDQASEKLKTISEKLGGGLKTAAMVGTAAVAAASTAVAGFTASAVKQFAEYEQLVGGVETLFKNSSDVVQRYAEKAYKTAGLSANEYMSTVTGFSASLLQSLGGDTEKAAKYADMAIIDMADNANKMGTSMESIQYAYQGFAKQNYTMLDNLKLGYGGTKEEMKRLLEDAERLSGIHFDISSFADVTEAIHIIQENMGIAGTTALEAEETIEGSFNSMKSAWTNFVTGIANENANTQVLLSEFVESVKVLVGNIVPVVSTVLTNIGTLLLENAPAMIEQGVTMLANFLTGLTNKMPEIIAFMGHLIVEMGNALLASAPQLIGAALGLMGQLLASVIESAMNIGKNLVEGVWQGIKSMRSTFKSNVMNFFSNIVDSVKSVLGIHSPSRVFAEIGKNMVLGLGGGWSENISGIKSDIMNDMDFGTATLKANTEYEANGNFGGSGAKSVNVVQNIYSQAMTAADLVEEALYQQKMAVMYV